MKNEYFILIIILLIIYIFKSVIKSGMPVKESFFWLVGSFCALFLAIFPGSISVIANFFGVNYPPTILLVLCIVFLLFMIFRDNKIISSQNEKITELAQQIAILKEKIDKRKK